MKKPEVVAIFDAGNRIVDRYTVVLNRKIRGNEYEGIALSANPDSPQGVAMHVEVIYDPDGDNFHLGKEILFNELPEEVKRKVSEMIQ